MNLYCAAVYSNNYCNGQNRYVKLTDHERSLVNSIPHILESWAYVGKQQYVDNMRLNRAQIFLDSGAFTAFTLGMVLSVAEYCEYIQRNSDILRRDGNILMASVLDGIGDPLQTYRNQLEMEARGCRPLPCFHAGEDERYLELYVKNYEYITLGGMVGSSTKQLSIWLDRIWDRYLTDGSGHPRLKVHGFGITAIPLLMRYPWHSADSSSWIQSAAFGSIVTPAYGPISVSEKSPTRHDWGQHATTLSPIETDCVFRMLEDQGFTYQRLSSIYESRAAYNLWAFGVINTMINAARSDTFRRQVQELF